MAVKQTIFPIILAVLILFAVSPAAAQMMGGGQQGYGMGQQGMMYGPQGQQGYGMGQGRGMMRGQQGYGMGQDMMYGYDAGADPKMVREAYEMRQKFAEQTYSIRKEYFEKSRLLSMELYSEKPDKAKVQDLAKRIKVVWGELYDASIKHALEMSAKGLGGYGMDMMGGGMMMGQGMMHGGMMGPGMMHSGGMMMGPGMMRGYR